MNGQSNTSASGIWLLLVLLALAVASYIIYRLVKHEPDEDDNSGDGTSHGDGLIVVCSYFRDYYFKIRNQLSRSYNLMYSLTLAVDDKLPDPIKMTDLRDVGLDYETAKKIGYPYVSGLVNSENHSDWNMNLSKAHSILKKMAEISVIESVLNEYSSSLEVKARDELKNKFLELSRECDLFPRIKDVLAVK